MKKFAVFDLDGTLIRWQLYHATADALAKSGIISSDDFRAVREARMRWKQRTHKESFKEYESTLVDVYDQLLTQLDMADFDKAATAVFDEYKDQVYTYTRNLIETLKQEGYLLLAISGSQSEIVEMIAKHYGFDDYSGSIYERKDNRFSGKKTVHIGSKHKILDELVAKYHATYEGSIGVGDSGGDISMLSAVERPIAFNPDQKLFDHAREKGWKVVVERKNVVYELEMENDIYILG